MLPVYRAISYRDTTRTGRTRPWVVFVRTPGGVEPYVVKMFDTLTIESRNSVTNEVIGNVLAGQFGLKTPRAALIDFDQSFKSSLRDLDLLERLENSDDRLKFGTELLEGNVSNLLSFNSSEARAAVDIDTLFAFDNLIMNGDRTRNPTNLLVRSEEVFLIDHEFAFDIPKDVSSNLKSWNWPNKYAEYHVCYEYLKKSTLEYKKEYFNVFHEDLRLLNISGLTSYFNQLESVGYSATRHPIIRDYLLKLKLNSNNFVNALKGKIS
jgi:hypothetical protein